MSTPDPSDARFDAAHAAAGLVRWDHSIVEVRGKDRIEFLQNMLTNDFQRETGDGCESFVTNVQGKILAYVWALILEDAVWLLGAPEGGQSLIAHLDRYLIREDVTLAEVTADWATHLGFGKEVESKWSALASLSEPLSHFAEGDVRWVRAPWLVGSAALAIAPAAQGAAFAESAEHAGFAVGPPEWEARLRVANLIPVYGRDIDERNLPQEVDRDAQAISFRKGCYLGQETVARIDALGRVHWLLRRLRLQIPKPDWTPPENRELTVEGKAVMRVGTIATPDSGDTIALGYVRREHAEAVAPVVTDQGVAFVVLAAP